MELERTSRVKATDHEYEHRHFFIKINIHVSYDIGFYIMLYNTFEIDK
jgi:hypothetical protein